MHAYVLILVPCKLHQAGVGIIFAGVEGQQLLFVDAMVQGGPAEISGQVTRIFNPVISNYLLQNTVSQGKNVDTGCSGRCPCIC